jgi:hypothetical protein|tara:strand:- start:1835 stop:1996 length:162 start_codon:yes stop_codon:yes gene_type:complete
VLLIVVLISQTADMYTDHVNYSSNWCAKEIEIMRDQISDLWYINGLNGVQLDD